MFFGQRGCIVNVFLQMIWEPIREVLIRGRYLAPKLMATMTIVLIGYVLAWTIRRLVGWLLRIGRFDRWSDRLGLTLMMRKADYWSKPSAAVSSVVFWLILILSIMTGLSALKFAPINRLISQSVLYLPRVFSALLILIFGYIISGFISRGVLIAAINSGIHYAKMLAEAIRMLLTVLILAMALEQLQVAPGIVVAAFSIIFGGIVLTLSISFGVGGIDAAKKMIEQGGLEKEDDRGSPHPPDPL